MYDAYFKMAMEQTNLINEQEDILAMERYGCTWEELGEDERGEISMDVADMMDSEYIGENWLW